MMAGTGKCDGERGVGRWVWGVGAEASLLLPLPTPYSPLPISRRRNALHRAPEVLDCVDHFLLHLAARHRRIEQRCGGAGDGSDGEYPREIRERFFTVKHGPLLSPANVRPTWKTGDDRRHRSPFAAMCRVSHGPVDVITSRCSCRSDDAFNERRFL